MGREVGTVGLAVGVEDLAVGLVGVADLAVGLEGVEDLDGPVDGAEGFVDLVGVEDLDGPADLVDDTEAVERIDVDELEGLGEEECNPGFEEDIVPRDVGVEDLEGFDDVDVGRPVGVAGLDPPPGVTGLEPGPPDERGLDPTPPDEGGLDPGPPDEGGLDPGPPDEEGLRIPETEEFKPVDAVDCLGITLFLPVVSVWEFPNYITVKNRLS